MDCDEFVELVTLFLDGALDAATEQRFVDHLSLCDGCDAYLDQFRRTIQTVGELPPESLSAPARDKLLSAFRSWQR
ncbi:anti-sigma factor [Nocardia sp. NBC_01503]|uniref:anti-sigma factor family protein n=1 Tax=Nocardia sp. NBC_01503 TaxID=2975997 RepID=UPI002E7BE5B8|nr:zf-HC2 domain-containing protein [Nocardia sp. NBC_01503]WTL32100.1 anti-sigma factor [Nocardia sp. NBC_01503]